MGLGRPLAGRAAPRLPPRPLTPFPHDRPPREPGAIDDDVPVRTGPHPLIDRLGRWAEQYPDDRAYTYMDYATDIDGVGVDITWGELDRRSRAVAASLRAVTDAGQRVAILARRPSTTSSGSSARCTPA
ncbi:hypothetical protein [Actinomadura sp. J1-007]|uniref:hypothetical protein n=1 Tax=Actinomadura sp. J1-007 TaxID=2661913 RepID=UPI001F4F3B57|nr:hypothetical protein [Actinomadura sp. J1-007]